MLPSFISTRLQISSVLCALCLFGCTTSAPSSTRGIEPQYVDPSSRSNRAGIGVESQDIRAMTDEMVRDMLSTSLFAGSPQPPRIIVDDTRFVNESNQILNINLITDRLRVELMRAADGRMYFVSRENVDLVKKEKDLKAKGSVDEGINDNRQMIAGADYRLIGRITSRSSQEAESNVKSNYVQFSFEVLDLANGLSVWGNLYDIKKIGANDTIYH